MHRHLHIHTARCMSQRMTRPNSQLSMGLEHLWGALRSHRQHHSQSTMHIFQIQVGWDGMRSVPLFPYVLAMYMLCTSTGSNSLAQLILSHCKKCYWAVKSCTATKPLMVKQHLHVWVWVCGQLTAKCYCVRHMQFNTVGSSEPDLHNGYIKMLPLINLSSWFHLWHLWGTALGVEDVSVPP